MNTIKIPKEKIKKGTCNVLLLPKEVCSIKFNKDKYYRTLSVTLPSNRRDMVLLHANKKGELIEIELVNDDKPCIK